MMYPYEVCMLFTALKRHFTSNYDFIKYNGKVKMSFESFFKRKDKYFFKKLAQKDDLQNFIIANLLFDSNIWAGDLLDSKADSIYFKWKSRVSAIKYTFSSEIKTLAKENDSFSSLLKVSDNQHPELLVYFLKTKISPETMLIINDLTSFISVWDSKLREDVIWSDISLKLKKYQKFFKPNIKRIEFAKIILDNFSSL